MSVFIEQICRNTINNTGREKEPIDVRNVVCWSHTRLEHKHKGSRNAFDFKKQHDLIEQKADYKTESISMPRGKQQVVYNIKRFG